MIDPKQLEIAISDFSRSPRRGFGQLKFPFQATHHLAWLSAQTDPVQGFWRDRSHEEVSYIGILRQATTLEELQQLVKLFPDSRFYGGMAFDPLAPQWSGFKDCHFILPRIELRKNQHGYQLFINAWFERDNDESEYAAIRQAFYALKEERIFQWKSPRFRLKHHLPNKEQWKQSVDQVIHPESLRHLPKVVLARCSCYQTLSPFDATKLLQCWGDLEPDNYAFLINFGQSTPFFGVPPERLFLRKNHTLYSEALAGTCAKGDDPTQSQQFANKLLHDQKNCYENQLVADAIRTTLEPYCQTFNIAPATIQAQSKVQHIRQSVQAKLLKHTTDTDLIRALHPTPAVAGYPRTSAMSFLRTNEPFDRGWYAGIVGYISTCQSDFTVAIRSALQNDNELKLFAGAGIVKGSQSELEWLELNQKIMTITGLLND